LLSGWGGGIDSLLQARGGLRLPGDPDAVKIDGERGVLRKTIKEAEEAAKNKQPSESFPLPIGVMNGGCDVHRPRSI
jgi:hypothetical protein